MSVQDRSAEDLATAAGGAPVPTDVFVLERATVRYPGASGPALEGASFRVRTGECVALVGPNGAGKTTALRALLGLTPLVSGRAEVLGRPSAGWAREALAREVGVVAQREEPVFPITVLEAVEMGRYAHAGPWRALDTRDRDAVARAMARADVAALEDRWVETLSGGEWQRVRVARALAQEPRALVLDEPTASLDLSHEMQLFELIADLVRHDRLAALIVSHHLNVAARFADRLVVVAGGRVVADAAPDVVLEAARMSEVFAWPVAVQRLGDGAVQLYPERQPLSSIPGEPTR
jgi:iron complex transport system ATP-binding protein